MRGKVAGPGQWGRMGPPPIGPQDSKAVGHSTPWQRGPSLRRPSFLAGAPPSPTTSRHGGHPRPPGLGRMIQGTAGLSLPHNKAPGSPGGAPWQHPEGGGPLAVSPLLLEHCVHVLHLAEPLEEGQQVQQFRVRHVIEPGGHRHLQVAQGTVWHRGQCWERVPHHITSIPGPALPCGYIRRYQGGRCRMRASCPR